MGQVGGDTGGVDNIVEVELADQRARLHEKRQRLANATGGSCDDCEGCNMSAPDSLTIAAPRPHVLYIPTLTISAVLCGGLGSVSLQEVAVQRR